MDKLLNIFGYLSVLLRAATLCFQTLTIGGIIFIIAVTRAPQLRTDAVVNHCRKWIVGFSLTLAATQVFYVLANTLILMQSADMPFRDAVGANFVYAGALAAAAALVVAAVCSFGKWRGNSALLIPAMLILASALMTSHSVARMQHRVLLTFLTGLHQLATAAWIGGLPYLSALMETVPTAASAEYYAKIVREKANPIHRSASASPPIFPNSRSSASRFYSRAASDCRSPTSARGPLFTAPPTAPWSAPK